MYKIILPRYLFVILGCLPLLPLSSVDVLAMAAKSNNSVQSQSGYDLYMQQGYASTAKRKYKAALDFFMQALKERPRDKYAEAAIRNIEGYIKRNRNARIVFVPVGKPGNRTSAASRSDKCWQGDVPIPLIPKVEPQFTASEYPTFFFHVPQNTAQAFEFILEEESSGKQLYKSTFKPVSQSGIININLSQNPNKIPLEPNKTYNWTFSLVCNTQARDKDMFVEGTIQQMQPDVNLSNQLKIAQPLESATLYAASGFWFDALSTLANLRQKSPSDAALKADWEDLLKSVGLESVAKASFVDCCKVQN